jgi:hypothetical protein
MLRSISAAQTSLDGIRHTFVPITIPQFLQIPRLPPPWAHLPPDKTAEFERIAAKNDTDQLDLIARLKRSGLRSMSVSRMTQLLATQQERIKELNEMRQFSLLSTSLVSTLRPAVNLSHRPNSKLVKLISNFQAAQTLETPYDGSSLELFLLQLFDEGPLSHGIESPSIIDEIATIATALTSLNPAVPADVCVSFVRANVADQHLKTVIESVQKVAAPFQTALKNAIEFMRETVSMEDFAGQGEVNPLLTDAFASGLEFTGVDAFAMKLQEIGDLLLEGSWGKTDGAKMIATTLVSEKVVAFPEWFIAAIVWCSDDAFEQFGNKVMFMKALDLILGAVPKDLQ